MSRALILTALLAAAVAGCGGSSASGSPSFAPNSAGPSPRTSIPTSSSTASASAEIIPLTGHLSGTRYVNPVWGITVDLPAAYTYIPLSAYRDTATGLVIEQTVGATTSALDGNCIFAARLLPGLSSESFSAMIAANPTAITWSPVTSITLSGRPALRLDGAVGSGATGILVTYLAFVDSGQILELVYPKAALLDPYLGSIVWSTPKT